MKKTLVLVLAFGVLILPFGGRAQTPPAPPSTSNLSAPAPAGASNSTAPILSADDLAKLVGPIALYPDPMISLILPASTVPSDIVMAARFLRANPKPDQSQIDAQSWDPSVKSLAHYPDVITMMNENLDWTNQLGAAVIAQQADVMTAIQGERAKAHQLGNLETTSQQKVIVQDQVIQVVPADPQVIYVPTYDPAVVYVQPAPPYAPLLTFGAGLALGAWIGGGCDWWHGGIWNNGCWGSGGWNNQVNINNSRNINISGNNINNWHPNNNRPGPRPPYNPNRPGAHGGGTQFPGFKPAPPGGWSGNNRPGGYTPNNRPGGNGGGTWNGNKPGGNTPNNRPGGGGNNPNLKPGGGGNKPAVRPGAGGGGTQNGGNRPSNTRPGAGGGGTRNGGNPDSSKHSPSDRRGSENRNFSAPTGGGGRFQQGASKPSHSFGGAGGGGFRGGGAAGGGGGHRGGGGGGLHRG